MAKTKKSEINEKIIRELAALLEETGLSEIEYQNDDLKIKVAKAANVTQSSNLSDSAANQLQVSEVDDQIISNRPGARSNSNSIVSPMVGVVYLSPDPQSPPFANPGDKVAKDQTILLIEAMKVFNQIKSPKAGTLEKIFVEDGAPVEFGEQLFEVS